MGPLIVRPSAFRPPPGSEGRTTNRPAIGRAMAIPVPDGPPEARLYEINLAKSCEKDCKPGGVLP